MKKNSESTFAFLTLDAIKFQCSIEPEETYWDTYLTALGKAAERKVFKDTCRTYDEILEMEGEWPSDLTLAALMLCAHWYKNREPETNQSMYSVPYAYEALYYPYRKGTYSSVDDDEEEEQ